MNRNTKIVATFGPAVESHQKARALIRAGADVIRLNFSHGDYATHAAAVKLIRRVSAEERRTVAILQDLRGPKIRVGQLENDPLDLRPNEEVILIGRGLPEPESRPQPGHDPASADVASGDAASDEAISGDAASGEVTADEATPGEAAPDRSDGARTIPVEGYPTLSQDVEAGELVLLADGAMRLRIKEVVGQQVICSVEVGGQLSSRKGVNLPETHLKSIETITPKDWRDLEFGLAQGVDWVALSFVRSARDVRRLKKGIAKHGADVPVIAKIEKREALEGLDEIVAEADGIMVARGDLGVETELEEVVLRQKEIIRACNREGKVVITATQMLESMMDHPTPTRAEVADVSNAIFDGTDALMLSGETAVGRYPVESVAFMTRVAIQVEEALDAGQMLVRRPFLRDVADAVAHAACVTAHEIGAKALICLTRSGLTARLVSRYRPRCPVIAVSPDMTTVRRLTLHWGLLPVHSPGNLEGDLLVNSALVKAQGTGLVKSGDRVVLTAGVSAGVLRGKTNLVQVEILE